MIKIKFKPGNLFGFTKDINYHFTFGDIQKFIDDPYIELVESEVGEIERYKELWIEHKESNDKFQAAIKMWESQINEI